MIVVKEMKVKIVAIEPITKLDVTGKFYKVYKIYYEIEGRIVDWIEVREEDLDPDRVKSMIVEHAKKIGAILGFDISKVEIEVAKEVSGVPPLAGIPR